MYVYIYINKQYARILTYVPICCTYNVKRGKEKLGTQRFHSKPNELMARVRQLTTCAGGNGPTHTMVGLIPPECKILGRPKTGGYSKLRLFF